MIYNTILWHFFLKLWIFQQNWLFVWKKSILQQFVNVIQWRTNLFGGTDRPLKIRLDSIDNMQILYCSGTQPGVRVPPGVRETSQGVHQIIISLRITLRISMKQFNRTHNGVCEFYFFSLGVREQKKVGNRCSIAQLVKYRLRKNFSHQKTFLKVHATWNIIHILV